MANAAKPGADLLWAFQLHREHGALSKRLKALESTTSQQQERLTVDEHNARAAYDQRLDALARQLQTLQESEVAEQVAGLASELRATRQQVEQARDKVKSIESANKEIDDKLQEREQVVHARFGNLESTLAQVQRTLLGLEGRLQLAAEHGARVADEGLKESRQRHGEDIAGLSERLRGLQDAQNELRVLVEGVVRDGYNAPIDAPALDQTTTAPLNTAAASYVPTVPDPQRRTAALDETIAAPPSTSTASHITTISNPQRKKTVLDQMTSTAPSSSTASHIATMPDPKPAKAKAKSARRFSREIASLINGEGSLTNAPDIMSSQLPLETSKGGSKKRKAPADEGPLLRSTFTQRETRSQVKKVKEEPLATRAKAPPVKPSKQAASQAKPAGKKGTTRQAANISTTRVKKEPGRRTRALTPELPLQLPSSDQIQVAISQELVDSPTPTPLPLAARDKGKGKEKVVVKREEKPKQQPRRKIKQDDSMEEFLAKCWASTGGPGGGGGGN
jgi:predicted  nucleic acid-binding Zn-ribbon protein